MTAKTKRTIHSFWRYRKLIFFVFLNNTEKHGQIKAKFIEKILASY